MATQEKPQQNNKRSLDLRIRAEIREGLDREVQQSGRLLTAIVEEYLAAGLARSSGELVEQESLPAIRAAVREEVQKQMGVHRKELAAELAERMKRADDRLIKLIVKGARSSGIGHRMLYALIAKSIGKDYAQVVYEDAKAKTGKDLARRGEPGEEEPQ